MIFIIYGTRPEYIKLYPVVLNFLENKIEHLFISTNQHQNLVEDIENKLGVKPNVRLNVYEPGQSLAKMMAKITIQLEDLYLNHLPKFTIVQGDTISAFLGAVTSFGHQIPVAHLEAGLRTYNLKQPFPEEGYRQMISKITEINFCATEKSKNNLISEGIDSSKIYVTGNTVIDSLRLSRENLKISSRNWFDKNTVLVTSHRRENWGKNEENISKAVFSLAKKHPELSFVWPMHPNPILRESILKVKSEYNLDNVKLSEPLDYLDLIKLLSECRIIITDSGGIQEEAPSFGIPVLVTREATERPEGVEAGFSFLVGTDIEKITTLFEKLLKDWDYKKFESEVSPYGNGFSSDIITKVFKLHGVV